MKTVLILLTWLGAVPQMEQQLETKGEKDCARMERVIKANWKENHAEGFVGIIMCREQKIVLSESE